MLYAEAAPRKARVFSTTDSNPGVALVRALKVRGGADAKMNFCGEPCPFSVFSPWGLAVWALEERRRSA